jgi:hypothetical protein
MGHVGEDRTDEPQTTQRLTVAQAAAALGITEGAVRSRIKRGTLPTTREGGTVFVLLGGGTSQANQTPNTSVPADQSELVEALRDQVRYLREQLDAEREARTEERRRHDTLIAQLTSRIPAIEPPESPEPREEPERPLVRPKRVHPERAEPAEPVDPQREEPEKARPERVEPERTEPRESPVTAADEQQGRGPVPDAGGPQTTRERPSTHEQQKPRRGFWARLFGTPDE